MRNPFTGTLEMAGADKMRARKGNRWLIEQSILVCGGLLFWISLELGYRVFIVPNYDYAGFIVKLSPVKYFEALLIYFIFLLNCPSRWNRPSDFFVGVLLFCLIAPLLIYYALTNQQSDHLHFMVLAYVIILYMRRAPFCKIPTVNSGPVISFTILIIGTVSISMWLAVTSITRPLNFDLLAVYQYRSDADAVINQGIMGYLNNWCFKVFGPSLLALALWKRKYWLAGSVSIMHVFWFGASQHKSVLFFPLLVVCLWLFRRRLNALYLLPLAMALVVFMSLVASEYFDSMFMASLIVRRAFFVTANNVFDYYQFFSNNGFLFWSNSIFARFLDYPYELPPAKIISQARGLESHANTSFIATGFMHAGFLGVVAYAAVVALILRLIDSFASHGLPAWLVTAVLISPMISLFIGADLFSAMLTHGLIAALLVLFLLRDKVRSTVRGELNTPH